MTTKTFGRRGLDRTTTADVGRSLGFTEPRRPPTATATAVSPDDALPIGDMSLSRVLDHVPILTVGIAILLALIYAVETRLAFDLGPGGQPSRESLLALGAASRSLVLDHGDWWRVFLAPLLHASFDHLTGNLFALLVVGVRLEGLIGRAWLAGIFALSALTGMILSLAANPADIPSLGASGAITGVVAALFTMSFTRRADRAEAKSLRRTALFFGLPALAPLAWGASDGTDYFAHLGGALGGVLVGVVMLTAWPRGARRAAGGREIAIFAFALLLLSAGSGVVVAIDYSAWGASAAGRIPMKALPARIDASTAAAARDLVARWPADPRGRLVLGISELVAKHPDVAERELRTTIDLVGAAAPDEQAALRPTRTYAEAHLAVAVLTLGRPAEAQRLAAEICARPAIPADSALAPARRMLVKVKLCR